MRKFKVIIAGSRDFSNYKLLKEKCDFYLQNKKNIEVVSGKALGADFLGEIYAKNNKYSLKEFPAKWGQYGKSAGYIRNRKMAIYADVLIAFWDGQSKGTKHMIDLAKKYKLKVKVVLFKKKLKLNEK